MVRIGVIGLGFMGKGHLGVYARLPNARVVAMCDRNPASLDGIGKPVAGNIAVASAPLEPSSVRRYDAVEPMLGDGGFDAVDIRLPTDLHMPVVTAALEAGFHVFCEKPLAPTAAEADELAKTAHGSGRLMTVGHCLRYWPAYVEAKRIVDHGGFGAVRYAELTRFSAPPSWATCGWLLDPARSGNTAFDLHIHDVDMVLHLFGPPRTVRSSGVADPPGGFGLIPTMYGYEDATVTSAGGWMCSSSLPFAMCMHMVLERVTLVFDSSKAPMLSVYPEGGTAYAPELPEGDGYFHELADFIAGIERGRLSGTVTVESSAAAVRLCEIEIRSAREHRQIEIDRREYPAA